MDALLAFAHHDPETASPLARAGAFLLLEYFAGFRGLLKLLARLFAKR